MSQTHGSNFIRHRTVPVPCGQTYDTQSRAYWAVALGLAALGLAFVTYRAWVADDAYITFRHVSNVHLGYGPVFNPGERVQAYSHPLWFLLLLAGSYALTPYAAAVALGLAFTVAAVLAAAFFLKDSPGRAAGLLCWFLILFSSRTFVEFQTSGLETSLTALLLTILFGWLASRERRRDLVGPAGMAWLCGLLVLDRPDYAILCLPVLAGLFYAWRSIRRAHGSIGKGQWLAMLAAALAVLSWYGFSTVYYGTPLPNTAYAKTSLSLLVGLGKSWSYAKVYAQDEPFHAVAVLAIMAATFGCAVTRIKRADRGGFLLLCLALAISLHLAYVFAIGSDFMRGRVYLPVLVGSAMLAAQLVGQAWPRLVANGRVPAFLGIALVIACGLRARPLWMLMQLVERLTRGRSADVLSGSIFLLMLLACAELLASVLAWRISRRRWAFAGIQLGAATILGAGIVAADGLTFSAGVALAGLAVAVLLAACPVASARDRSVPAVVGVAFIAAAGSVCDFTIRKGGQGVADGIADEWAWYRPEPFHNPFREPNEQCWFHPGLSDASRRFGAKHGPITVMLKSIGIFAYHAGPNVRVLDLHGLTDAFVARGYAKRNSRVGHASFEVPRSYLEAKGAVNLAPDWVQRVMRDDESLLREVQTAQSRVVWTDAEALERYTLVREVVSGPIFTASRWRKLPAFICPRRPESGRAPADWVDLP